MRNKGMNGSEKSTMQKVQYISIKITHDMGKLVEFWAFIHTFYDTCRVTRTPGLESDSQKFLVKGSVVEIEL